MKMIYLSHPYTGDESRNRDKAHLIAARLAKEYPGIVFLNPLDAMRHTVTAGLDYDTVIRQCIDVMKRCNGIIMTGNWRESRGCMMEYRTAQDTGMRIYDGLEEFRQGVGLEEERTEVLDAAVEYRRHPSWNNRQHLMEELADLKTVCTSWQNALGADEDERGAVQRAVNRKNRKRGYLNDSK